MEEKKAILYTNNLSIGYKENKRNANVLLDNLNFSIYPGDFICLLGPNGCGKSTLLKTLCGIQKPINGDIFIDGKSITEYSNQELSKKISIVLTEILSVTNATVYSIVSMGRYPYNNWLGVLNKEDFKIINDVIDMTCLTSVKNNSFLELSDGIRQKVMIARALAQYTPIILLDEPTVYLDAPTRIEIILLLRKLSKELNRAIILSSHDIDLALQTADAVFLISREKKMIIDTPEDLVLNGHFENAFNKNGVRFQLHRGTFETNAKRRFGLQVIGSKTEVFWTERALERIGITANQSEKDALGVVKVENFNGKLLWHLEINTNKYKCHSIAELIKQLTNFTRT
ncbi:ABC transporter ATP-binding protein [Melioribacteraceae bacterium 4301-Me]|uniref:ABC transporter ATP-binding protein n=1 Tax=Pyranulibacter aquaticus TaxID=3163344 RepID=UPI00359B9AE4